MGSVGFRVFRFEACSAFTARFGLHRRQIAKQSFPPETPTGSSPPPPLQLLTGQERPQPGGIPTRKTTNAFPRRTQLAKDRNKNTDYCIDAPAPQIIPAFPDFSFSPVARTHPS
jgi:hypothetical protein